MSEAARGHSSRHVSRRRTNERSTTDDRKFVVSGIRVRTSTCLRACPPGDVSDREDRDNSLNYGLEPEAEAGAGAGAELADAAQTPSPWRCFHDSAYSGGFSSASAFSRPQSAINRPASAWTQRPAMTTGRPSGRRLVMMADGGDADPKERKGAVVTIVGEGARSGCEYTWSRTLAQLSVA